MTSLQIKLCQKYIYKKFFFLTYVSSEVEAIDSVGFDVICSVENSEDLVILCLLLSSNSEIVLISNTSL